MKLLFTFILIILFSTSLLGQDNRVGTTAATFLEMGIGSAGNAMGEAYVSVARDLSSIYWNPSGLAYMESNEVQFMYRPWIADINITFVGGAIFLPRIGTLALSITSMDFGSTEKTTLDMQEGTGEMFSATDYAVSFSYARKLAQWFAFGATGKFISSRISRLSANAIAMDLGVMVNTHFFSPDGNRVNGLTIGMSISNYGTRMRYDGMELLRPIDISEDYGNYKDVEGQFKLQSWDLPLIFRIGVSLHPIITGSQRVTLSLDALHPNNNSESINAGAEYQVTAPGIGRFFLRGGWHGLFMDETQYGLAFGGGVHLTLLNNKIVKVDYAFQDVGILGNHSTFTLGIVF